MVVRSNARSHIMRAMANNPTPTTDGSAGIAPGISEFVSHKLAVAAALEGGGCGGDYLDGAIIVASLLSAMASDVWPGKGNDKRRFVQLWVEYLGPEDRRVSIRLLIQQLRGDGRTSEAAALEAKFPEHLFWPGSPSVLLGDEVDMAEDDVLALCPSLPRRTLRAHSYPVLFYEEVRSAGVHEYQIGEKGSAWPMTFRPATVSYVNRLIALNNNRRHIFFHGSWLRRLTAQVADRIGTQASPSPSSGWWVDGGASVSSAITVP